MPSQDFLNLTKLLYEQDYKILNLELKFDGIPNIGSNGLTINGIRDSKNNKSIISLQKGNENLIFESSEMDVFFYVSSFQVTIDNEGNHIFTRVKDTKKYYSDVKFLLDPDGNKKKAALEKVANGNFQPSYDPEKMVRKFLLSPKKASDKFEVLKTEYFEICAYFLLLSKSYIDLDIKLKADRPKYNEYCIIIDKLLDVEFRKDTNFIKSFLKYKKNLDLDIEDSAITIAEQKRHDKKVLNMLAKQGPMEVKTALRFSLDCYRRYAELVSQYMNSIRIILELSSGIEIPKSFKKSVENYKIIKNDVRFITLLDSFDPRIRHSESHINTIIDEKNRKLIITERKKGKREIICQYSIDDFQGMLLVLINELTPALVNTFNIHELIMVDLVLHSEEYLIAILGIGNKR
jgi:hypothetical protein